MAGSTYSSNLKIELMSTGENSGTWGDITNTNLGTALEQAIVGYGNPSYASDANLTISITNSNASQAARALVLNVTSAVSLTATRELVVPTIQKQYIVQNNTTGSQSITVKTSAGTGITVPNGRKAHLYVDGTNVIQMFDFINVSGGTINNTTIGATTASSGAFTTLTASGATTLNGAVALGDASGDLITVPGTINSNLLFTDNTYDIGASGATRPRNLFLAGAATIGGNLSVGGTLTLTGGLILNGNVTVGDSSADTLTVNATITSNLIFTDNTYDIGASGATRPRNLFLAGNSTIGGNETVAGTITVDSTTDSSSTTTGSIQTDGGLGVAKALYVGTTANIAGAVTLSGGTANGVAYLNGSKVLTTGSALTFDGTTLTTPRLALGGTTLPAAGTATLFSRSSDNNTYLQTGSGNSFLVLDGSQNTMFQASPTLLGFNISNAEQMRLTSTGLGIGTSSPYVKLQVTGTIKVATGNAQGILSLGDGNGATTNVGLWRGAANAPTTDGNFLNLGGYEGMVFAVGAAAIGSQTERMRLDSSGNLGLGASSMSLWGTASNPAIYIKGTNSGYAGRSGALVLASYDGLTNVAVANDSGSGALQFYIGTSEKMRLDASGNLLVGNTADPIGGNRVLVQSAGTANNYRTFTVYNSAASSTTAFANRIAQLSSLGNGADVTLHFTDQTAYNCYIGMGSGNLYFATNGTTERARITSTGSLLLGNTTSCNWQVSSAGHVTFTTATANTDNAGDAYRAGIGWQSGTSGDAVLSALITAQTVATYSANLLFLIRNTGGGNFVERARITSGGLFGLGTNNPQTALQVNAGAPTIRLEETTSGGSKRLEMGVTSAGVAFIGANQSAQDLLFQTTGTERMRITSGGAVCIGTTSTFSNAGLVVDIGSGGTNRPIAVHGTGGVDGTYVDWLVSAPYGSNTTEINIIKSSISSVAGSSGLQFWISDGGGASTTTRSFQINRTSCTVVGSLSKGSGSFKIDHPLPEKTSTHHLVHSFIEGPQADLIYRGKVNLVNGSATINIDQAAGMTEGTFVVLCRDVQCFTTNESDWTAVRGSVSGNILTIEAQDQTCAANISWMVIGERQDKHMYDTDWTDDNGKVIVEPLKPIES